MASFHHPVRFIRNARKYPETTKKKGTAREPYPAPTISHANRAGQSVLNGTQVCRATMNAMHKMLILEIFCDNKLFIFEVGHIHCSTYSVCGGSAQKGLESEAQQKVETMIYRNIGLGISFGTAWARTDRTISRAS